MGVFDINGKFFKTLTKAGDFIILTLLAMVCSIPVITIGASLTAVFYAALKMARDEEGYVWKEFFKSFKQNLKQSILIELILAAFAAILLVDINVCAKWAADGGGTLVQLLMLHAPSATDHQHDDCYIWTDLFYNAVCRYHVYIDSVDFLY